MQDKTVKGLNEKIWYRLIKVTFLLLFVVTLLTCNVLIFEGGLSRVDQSRTTIKCLHKESRVLTPKELGITVDKHDLTGNRFDYKRYFEGYNEYAIRRILSGCFDRDVDDVFVTQRWYELGLHTKSLSSIPDDDAQQIQNMKAAYSQSEKARYLDYSFKLFEIYPQFSYAEFLKYIFIGNLAVLAFFELARRTFYYVLLGKVFPPKS